MEKLIYGENINLPLADIPADSLHALAQRGLSHELGNVVASKIVGLIRKAINPEKPSEVSTDAVRVWREGNASAINAWTSTEQTEIVKAILDGTLGVRAVSARGPALDPVETVMRRLAEGQVVEILKARGLKLPKGEEVIDFGSGVTRTRKQMIDNRLASNSDELRRVAQRQVNEAKRLREAAAKEAPGVDGDVTGGL